MQLTLESHTEINPQSEKPEASGGYRVRSSCTGKMTEEIFVVIVQYDECIIKQGGSFY